MPHRLLLGLVLVAAPFAPALAQECGGRLVEVRNIMGDGANPQKLGELQLYYNASNGNNCARTMHSAATWGVETPTAVSLGICDNRRDRTCNHPQLDPNPNPNRFAYDSRPYRYQAGPVRVHAPSQCVRAGGSIFRNGKHHTVLMYGHCQ